MWEQLLSGAATIIRVTLQAENAKKVQFFWMFDGKFLSLPTNYLFNPLNSKYYAKTNKRNKERRNGSRNKGKVRKSLH